MPVPPLTAPSVPASVSVPADVIGPPLKVRPVVPPLALTEVTVPAPVTEIHSTSVPPGFSASTRPALPL